MAVACASLHDDQVQSEIRHYFCQLMDLIEEPMLRRGADGDGDTPFQP
jgi:hypothetical protein